MARNRKKRTVWNAEIERNITKDYASGLAITDIARCYHVPVSRIVLHLENYGLLDSNADTPHADDPVLQANIFLPARPAGGKKHEREVDDFEKEE